MGRGACMPVLIQNAVAHKVGGFTKITFLIRYQG